MSATDLPVPNIPLLRKAVEWAEAEASKTDGTCLWNQELWATKTDCGTTFCIAGYVVATAHPTAEVVDPGPELLCPIVLIDGEQASWGETAQELLGITGDEADLLFEGNNTIGAVRQVAEWIAARAGERL